jgi:hypothetical protein
MFSGVNLSPEEWGCAPCAAYFRPGRLLEARPNDSRLRSLFRLLGGGAFRPPVAFATYCRLERRRPERREAGGVERSARMPPLPRWCREFWPSTVGGLAILLGLTFHFT